MSDPETKPTMSDTDNRARRPPRRRRRLLTTLKVLAMITMLLLVLHTVLNVTTEVRLNRTIARLAADGLPTKVEQLVPAPVPPEQNGAVPLRAAFGLRDDDPSGKTGTSAQTNEIADWYRPGPTPARPDGSPDPAQAATIREKVAAPAMVLLYDKLYEAASCSTANWDLDYAAGPGTRLPHVSKLRVFARLLGARAWLRAEQGDYAGALADLRVMVRLGRLAEQEPILISQLLRIAIEAIATRDLQRLLLRPRPVALPTDAVAELTKELQAAREGNRAAMVRSADGERLGGGWLFDHCLGRQRAGPNLALSDLFGEQRAGIFDRLYTSYPFRPVLKTDYRKYLELMAGLRREYNKPYWDADREVLGQAIPRWCILSRMLVPVLEKLPAKAAQGEADLLLAEVALALDQYRYAKGQYPADLKELGLAAEPLDPFTGKPLIYRRTAAGGALLYSVGANGTDDGGQVGPVPGQPLDIVWEVRP